MYASAASARRPAERSARKRCTSQSTRSRSSATRSPSVETCSPPSAVLSAESVRRSAPRARSSSASGQSSPAGGSRPSAWRVTARYARSAIAWRVSGSTGFPSRSIRGGPKRNTHRRGSAGMVRRLAAGAFPRKRPAVTIFGRASTSMTREPAASACCPGREEGYEPQHLRCDRRAGLARECHSRVRRPRCARLALWRDPRSPDPAPRADAGRLVPRLRGHQLDDARWVGAQQPSRDRGGQPRRLGDRWRPLDLRRLDRADERGRLDRRRPLRRLHFRLGILHIRRSRDRKPNDGCERDTVKPTTALAWGLAAASVALTIAHRVLLTVEPQAIDPLSVGGRLGVNPWFTIVLTLLIGLWPFAVVGALVAARQPRNPIGWLFCAIALSEQTRGLASTYARGALVANPGGWPGGVEAIVLARLAAYLPFTLALFALLLFPTGRVPSTRWKPLLSLFGAFTATIMPIPVFGTWPALYR